MTIWQKIFLFFMVSESLHILALENLKTGDGHFWSILNVVGDRGEGSINQSHLYRHS